MEVRSTKFKFPTPVPEIPVRDVATAAAYYRDHFGFTLDWGGGEIGLAGISRGRCRMFLADQEHRMGFGNVGPILTWLNLDSNDEVDELHSEWSGSGARLLSTPESKPFGLHEFIAADLESGIRASRFVTPANCTFCPSSSTSSVLVTASTWKDFNERR